MAWLNDANMLARLAPVSSSPFAPVCDQRRPSVPPGRLPCSVLPGMSRLLAQVPPQLGPAGAPSSPMSAEPRRTVPSMCLLRPPRHSELPPRASSPQLEPRAHPPIGPDEEEVRKVFMELEEIQSKTHSERKSAEVVRLGALVGGAHPTVPQAKGLSPAEKMALWKERISPDCATTDVAEVPSPHPDWNDPATSPTCLRVEEGRATPPVPALRRPSNATSLEEGRATPPPASLGHLPSPRYRPPGVGEPGEHGGPVSQERRPQSSSSESSRSVGKASGLKLVLARLASLEQKMEAEREGTRAIVEKYEGLIREREESHARDVDALREMIVVAHSQQQKGKSVASGSKSTCSGTTTSSYSRS